MATNGITQVNDRLIKEAAYFPEPFATANLMEEVF